jgi:hypothetical protein
LAGVDSDRGGGGGGGLEALMCGVVVIYINEVSSVTVVPMAAHSAFIDAAECRIMEHIPSAFV